MVAANTYGADLLERPARLLVADAPLAAALVELQRRSGVSLVYSPSMLPASPLVSCSCTRATIGEALDRLLRGVSMRFSEIGTHVLIEPEHPMALQNSLPNARVARVRDISASPVISLVPSTYATGIVQGRVVSAESRQGVSGVSISVRGSTATAVSAVDGRYRIVGVPAGRQEIVAQTLGYAESSQSIIVRDDEVATLDFVLDPTVLTLNQIVVTGTVVPTQVRALPTPITVVTSTQIERQRLKSLDEIFRVLVPGGVQSEESPGLGGYVSYSLRGTSALGSASTLKVYVDGIEVQDPAYVKNIDPSIIERVEVSAGPQASTIYGSGAVSGVMQIFTKKGVAGPAQPTVAARASIGLIDGEYVDDSALRQEYSTSVSGGGNGFSYNTGATWQEEGDWIPHGRTRAGNIYAGGHIEHGSLTADFTLRYRGDFSRSGLNPMGFVTGDTSTVPPTMRGDQRWTTYGMRLGYAVLPNWQHHLTIGSDGNTSERYTVRPRGRTPADTFNTVISSDWHRTSVNYNTSYQRHLGNSVGLTLTAGGDYSSFTQVGYSNFSVSKTTGSFGANTSAYRTKNHVTGVFGQTQVAIREALFLTAGVHGDRSPGEDGTELSPRVGFSYVHEFAPVTVKVRAAYGSALVAPNPNNKLGNETATSVLLPNADLRPERQRGYDTGVELFFGNLASVAVTYFNQKAVDLVSLIQLGRDEQNRLEQQYQNVGRIHNRGIELSSTLAPSPSIFLTAVLGVTNSTVESLGSGYTGDLQVGDQLTGVPDYTAGVTLSWMPFSGTTLTGSLTRRAEWREVDFVQFFDALRGGTYTGRRRDYWVDYPSYTKFNAGVTQDLTSRLSAYVQLDNAGNSYAFERINLIAPRGRVVTVGASFKSQ
jgi:outer membrane receptor protein involved in Fe transport